MSTLEKLQSALDVLNSQRAQVAEAGWSLQHCWLVQVKPGGTARTDCKYWQVRSRQPMFVGKTLKHLKPDEVEDYRAAIDRGRQLKQIEREIEQLQKMLAKLTPTLVTLSGFLVTPTADCSTSSSESLSSWADESPLQIPLLPIGAHKQTMETKTVTELNFTDLAEQERQVKEVLANTQALRASLRRSVALAKKLERGLRITR